MGEKCDGCGEGISQHLAINDLCIRKPSCSGIGHIVTFEFIQHCRPQHPGRNTDNRERHCCRWQNQRFETAVRDHTENGDLNRKGGQQDQRQPKARHTDPNDADNPHDIIENPAFSYDRDGGYQYREDDDPSHCHNYQHTSYRKGIFDIFDDRLAVCDCGSKVAGQHALYVVGVAFQKGGVQSQLLPHSLNLLISCKDIDLADNHLCRIGSSENLQAETKSNNAPNDKDKIDDAFGNSFCGSSRNPHSTSLQTLVMLR